MTEKATNLLRTLVNNYNFYPLLCQTILVLLCLAGYHHALSGATFVFDDSVAIVKNKDVSTLPTNWSAIFSNDFWGVPLESKDSHKSYRPLTILMFHFEYALLGLGAAHMKVFNLLLHCVNTLLVWRLVRSLYFENIDSERLATIAAALFAVHPVHTEAVSGVVGRADLMFSLIYLLCLILTLSDGDSISSVAIILLLTAAGILFKETAITIPLACVFLDYMHREVYLQPAKVQLCVLTSWRYLVYGIATFVFIVARIWHQNFESPQFKPVDNPVAFSEQFLTRVLSQQYLYVVNFWLLLCPQWLSFDWALGCIRLITDIWDLRLQTVLAFYSLIIVAILNYRRCVCVLLGLGLLVIPFLPASGLITVGFVIAERVLYVPSIGYCLMVAYGFLYCYNMLDQLHWLRAALKCALMLIFACFLLRTRQRASDWLNETQLFASALNVCSNNAKVHYNIARLATDRHEVAKAFEHYHKAIELYPNYESALMNLGNLYREQGQLETAEQYIKRAIDVLPDFAVAWMNLGIVQSARKNFAQALKSYEQALKYRKYYAVCYYNLGNLYLDLKQYNEALKHWQHAVALNPRQPKAWANILTMLDNRGFYEDALRLSEQALTHLPNETSIIFIRANVLGKLMKYVEAEMLYKYVIRMEPFNVLYHTNLGVLYHRWDKIDAAIESYKQAIQLNPKRAQTAQENLTKLLQRIAREQRKLS